ncbi:DUF1742-domain-containing protein [Annulohypoxylon truncatum]|uniref:DUF1742-domain-containing protein n=1 Tax=Annulohypoxylon truncatum TaxID=327061 RepID=UPI002008A90D|nr:DUF1742-domain-containing protein [Annulohypoxylon truncatum]KAI1205063.1 DUF1742-domain-containing protein [Annulohypoxylon truncatum]
MSFPNIWNHRKVADTSAKACEVCFKPTTSVLITPESKDFFYVCPSHLKDRGFCSPIIDQEAVAAKKKREMEEELERVKKEYEEKQRKKKEKETNPPKDSDKTKDGEEKETKKDDKKDGKKDDPKPDSKMDKAEDKTSPNPEEEPRVFSLQRTFYQQRLDKKRQVEMAKRNRERLNNPNFFPSVPKNLP